MNVNNNIRSRTLVRLENMEENAGKITHARVRTVKGKVTVISIPQILEFKTKPPINKSDFDAKKIYTAFINENSDDEDTEELLEVGVQIGDLASKCFQTTANICNLFSVILTSNNAILYTNYQVQ